MLTTTAFFQRLNLPMPPKPCERWTRTMTGNSPTRNSTQDLKAKAVAVVAKPVVDRVVKAAAAVVASKAVKAVALGAAERAKEARVAAGRRAAVNKVDAVQGAAVAEASMWIRAEC